MRKTHKNSGRKRGEERSGYSQGGRVEQKRDGDHLECPKNLEVPGDRPDVSSILPTGPHPVRGTLRPAHWEPQFSWRNYSRKVQIGGSHYN
jgi:hypothetical protein